MKMTEIQYANYDKSLDHYGKSCGNPCQGLTKDGEQIEVFGGTLTKEQFDALAEKLWE